MNITVTANANKRLISIEKKNREREKNRERLELIGERLLYYNKFACLQYVPSYIINSFLELCL